MGFEQLKMRTAHFTMLTDDELLELIDEDDKSALDYLINKYKGFILAKTRHYFLVGGDREDVIQEGLIGLYKAIRDYEVDRPASFRGFAELCITRNIITAIKAASRQKHIPLNSSLSLDKPIYQEDSEQTLLDIVEGSYSLDPQELVISEERLQQIKGQLASMLTDLERKVLELYLEGCSYKEISVEINRHIKSIDNALQRVKRKLESLTESERISL